MDKGQGKEKAGNQALCYILNDLTCHLIIIFLNFLVKCQNFLKL